MLVDEQNIFSTTTVCDAPFAISIKKSALASAVFKFGPMDSENPSNPGLDPAARTVAQDPLVLATPPASTVIVLLDVDVS